MATQTKADRLRALAPGCAIAVPIGGGPFNVIVHETDDYFVTYQAGGYVAYRAEMYTAAGYKGEPIEWEAL